MKRAFGSRGRSNMGTVREVGRAVGGPSSSTTTTTTTTTRPINNNNNNNNNNNSLSLTQPLLLSSTCYSNLSCCSGGGSSSFVSPFVWPNYSTTSNCFCDGELDWVYVNGGEEEEEVWAPKTRVFDGFCLGPVPSQDEVEEAISALKCAANSASFMQLSRGQSSYASNKDVANQYDNDEMDMVSTTASELDWIEPSLIFNYPRALESYGAERVYEAFHLLQTEPLVQKIVSSLSTDKAVWEAVLNNDVVRELRDSYAAEGDTPEGSGSGSGRGASSTRSILKQMLDNFTAKIIALAEKLRNLVNEVILQSPEKETTGGAADLLGEKLISSVMLSVVVLLIVVVTRASRA